MQPDSGQNYWQPEEDDTQSLPSTPGPAPQPTTPAPPANPELDPIEEQSVESQLETAHENFNPVNWDASEYIDHQRDGLWFVVFITVTVVLLAAAIFLFSNYTFALLIVVMAVAIGIYTRRPPRVVHYSLTGKGLFTGEQFHPFSEFRAFGILKDGPLFSVMLLPTKRFSPATNVYFSENQGEEIVDILGSFLPMEELHLDWVDNLLRRLRL